MKNIDSSMAFDCDIEDLKFPEVKVRQLVQISKELSVIRELCESPSIRNDTRELLERDALSLQKKFDFAKNYPLKQE
jgi:hypothetical protein